MAKFINSSIILRVRMRILPLLCNGTVNTFQLKENSKQRRIVNGVVLRSLRFVSKDSMELVLQELLF
jgi:hypothetical protein